MSEDDFRRRRRERERQEDLEEALLKGDNPNVEAEDIDKLNDLSFASKRVDDLIRRVEPMIEQVNNLYNQYMAGLEERPPLERQKALEIQIAQLMMMNKPTPAQRFKVSSMQTGFQVQKERWAKLLRDLEAGKIKRHKGGKRGGGGIGGLGLR